ncbi:unnamed protein product [Linum tenue]|uniref:Uncharacterized protein n=1 Tax=Linum tenue TaxID=586396 RepID=A0AAV0NKG9_9ROSI|nr:unnamed protein product [Linum tenue]
MQRPYAHMKASDMHAVLLLILAARKPKLGQEQAIDQPLENGYGRSALSSMRRTEENLTTVEAMTTEEDPAMRCKFGPWLRYGVSLDRSLWKQVRSRRPWLKRGAAQTEQNRGGDYDEAAGGSSCAAAAVCTRDFAFASAKHLGKITTRFDELRQSLEKRNMELAVCKE